MGENFRMAKFSKTYALICDFNYQTLLKFDCTSESKDTSVLYTCKFCTE